MDTSKTIDAAYAGPYSTSREAFEAGYRAAQHVPAVALEGELLPCPFCGSEITKKDNLIDIGADDPCLMIHCKCGAGISIEPEESFDEIEKYPKEEISELINLWNTRARLSPAPDPQDKGATACIGCVNGPKYPMGPSKCSTCVRFWNDNFECVQAQKEG